MAADVYKITLADQDITRYVSQVPSIVETVGLYGQVAIDEIKSIQGINLDGFWDSAKPSSPFYNNDPKSFDLVIIKNGSTIFDGGILSIDGRGRSVTVNLQSALTKAFESGCIYRSTTLQTPADAVNDIAFVYGIPVETSSIAASNSEYTDNEVWIEVDAGFPDLTVFQIFQQIAEIGVAALSVVGGKLRFDLFRKRTSSPVFDFTDSYKVREPNILNTPQVQTIEKDASAGYSIETMDGLAFNGSETDRGKTISAGMDAVVRIKSLSAGIWLGEKWRSYLQHPQRRVTFLTTAGIGQDLPLFAPVGFNYSRSGWANETYDVTSVNNSSRITSEVVLESR